MEAVTVVCHTETLERVSAYTASLSFHMTIQVEAPSSVEDNLGSAEVLGLLSHSITVCLPKNVAHNRLTLSYYHAIHLPPYRPQISSPFILPKISLQQLYSSMHHRTKSSLISNWKVIPPQKSLLIAENDNSLYVGYQKSNHQLLFVKSAIDVHESLDLRTSLLWRYSSS